MRRFTYMLVLAGCLAVPGVLYTWSTSAWSSAAATGPGEIRITSREISRVRVNVGRQNQRVGDVEIVKQNLFNKRIRSKPIGHSEFVCTFTTERTRACTVTIFLPRGRLVAGGAIQYQELYELAVLGGTRLYDNARGTLTVIRTTRRPQRHILVFRLMG
ncbi:MAG TPA: hypothetical protein VF236_05950 [Gaiellaceae bacterium]